MLLNAAKGGQGYSFYRFQVIKEKPTGGKITPSPTQIRVKKVKRVPQKSNLATRFFVFCKLLYVN